MRLKQLRPAHLDYDTDRGSYYALLAVDPETNGEYRLIYLIDDSDIDSDPSEVIDWIRPDEVESHDNALIGDITVNFID